MVGNGSVPARWYQTLLDNLSWYLRHFDEWVPSVGYRFPFIRRLCFYLIGEKLPPGKRRGAHEAHCGEHMTMNKQSLMH